MLNDPQPGDGLQFLQLVLASFSFPTGLDNGKANFRFVVDVRYIDGKGNPATHHAVMPSPDTYWECDKRKEKSPNYVRANNGSEFDMSSTGNIDSWDRLVFLGRAQIIHSVQVKVFDVDRPDIWDKIQNALGSLIEALFGKAKSVVPKGEEGSYQSSVTGVFGSFVDDVSSSILKRLSNGEDVLFRGSWSSAGDPEPPITLTISGKGTSGPYKVVLKQSNVTIPQPERT